MKVGRKKRHKNGRIKKQIKKDKKKKEGRQKKRNTEKNQEKTQKKKDLIFKNFYTQLNVNIFIDESSELYKVNRSP